MSDSDMFNAGLIILFLFYCYFMIGGYTEYNCTKCTQKDSNPGTLHNDTKYNVKNSEYGYRPDHNANYLDTIQQDQNMMNIYQKAPWL